jgi:cytochrome b subunit of formate dehydrogenase
MEVCLDNNRAVRLEKILATSLFCVGVLLLIAGWKMYTSYPEALPHWVALALFVVIWGDALCLLASIGGILLTGRTSRFAGYAVLALVLLPVAAFLKNGDHVVANPNKYPTSSPTATGR